jgi:hypothetical protein
MKFGYMIVQSPHDNFTSPPQTPWWKRLFCCAHPTIKLPPPPITIYMNSHITNLRLARISDTTTVPYGKRWTKTTFPRRILFHDTCVVIEHNDPHNHHNCDPILAQILGEHPEFQTCLSSPYNGSYNCSANDQPAIALCRVKNNTCFSQKYILAYDDWVIMRENVLAV